MTHTHTLVLFVFPFHWRDVKRQIISPCQILFSHVLCRLSGFVPKAAASNRVQQYQLHAVPLWTETTTVPLIHFYFFFSPFISHLISCSLLSLIPAHLSFYIFFYFFFFSVFLFLFFPIFPLSFLMFLLSCCFFFLCSQYKRLRMRILNTWHITVLRFNTPKILYICTCHTFTLQ